MKPPSPNQEALNLQKKLNRLTRRAFAIHDQISGIRRQIELVCIHNETEKKDDYHEGGYLHKSEYIEKVICKTCGKVLKEKSTIGGFA